MPFAGLGLRPFASYNLTDAINHLVQGLKLRMLATGTTDRLLQGIEERLLTPLLESSCP
jgi:hypothetical protein